MKEQRPETPPLILRHAEAKLCVKPGKVGREMP